RELKGGRLPRKLVEEVETHAVPVAMDQQGLRPSESDADHGLVHGNVSSMVGGAEHEQILFERRRAFKPFLDGIAPRVWCGLPETVEKLILVHLKRKARIAGSAQCGGRVVARRAAPPRRCALPREDDPAAAAPSGSYPHLDEASPGLSGAASRSLS